MARIEKIREQEYADIRRWFSHSAFGTMFHADDGRAWPMDRQTASTWERQAQAVVDEFLGEQFVHNAVGVFIAIAVFTLIMLIGSLFDLGMVTGQAAVGAFMAAHLADLNSLYWHSRQIRIVKARIVDSLAATAPYPVEVASRRRRTNIWRVAMYVWIMVMISLASSEMLFGDYGQILTIALIGGVAVAWVLYFASGRVDFLQKQDDFRRETGSKPAVTVSPPPR